jgi:hypothetical protein
MYESSITQIPSRFKMTTGMPTIMFHSEKKKKEI